MRELPGWLLVAFSWYGMYATSLEILSRLGVINSRQLEYFIDPWASWQTGVIWFVTFWANLLLVLHVLEVVEADAKKKD